jgi:imidazole glycerol-phosphate synthase subunit HisF
VLRKRVVTALTFNDGILFRTKLFEPDYRYTLNFVDAWSVDEVVVLDVTRPGQGDRQNFLRVVRGFAQNTFVPLSVGGGIRNLDDVKELLDAGADKIVVNTGALTNPDLISRIAGAYGSQCVMLSIDVQKRQDGGYEVYSHFGRQKTGIDPVSWAQEGETSGAGEILVTPIQHDGSLQGYDLELCRSIADTVSVPVLILGGAGNWKHFIDGFEIGHASGVCTQNIYHFTEASIKSAKSALHKAGLPVRHQGELEDLFIDLIKATPQ